MGEACNGCETHRIIEKFHYVLERVYDAQVHGGICYEINLKKRI